MMVYERTLHHLRQAGAEGLSARELASAVYGETTYRAVGCACETVARLRRKGFEIHTVIIITGKGAASRKYILASSEENHRHPHDDEPSRERAGTSRNEGRANGIREF